MNKIISLLLNIRGGLNHLGDYGFIDTKPIGDTIPHVVHQTYFSKVLPTEIQENLEKLKQANPGWEFKLYDDHDIEHYIQQHYPSLTKIYHQISPVYGVAKADLFRYLVIYNEGGVYLDIKSSIEKPLNETLQPNDHYLLSHWQNGAGQLHAGIGFHRCINNPHGEFQQWHIIATKGHPFLKAVIENVCNNIVHYNPLLHDTGGWGVVNLTGPIAYTLAISKHLHAHPHRLVSTNADLGLIYSLYESKSLGVTHHSNIKKHYTHRTESITTLSNSQAILFKILGPFVRLAKRILLKFHKRTYRQISQN
jgi:inositol phosphorylceramide mannosyltransferase catalytic subunit